MVLKESDHSALTTAVPLYSPFTYLLLAVCEYFHKYKTTVYDLLGISQRLMMSTFINPVNGLFYFASSGNVYLLGIRSTCLTSIAKVFECISITSHHHTKQ